MKFTRLSTQVGFGLVSLLLTYSSLALAAADGSSPVQTTSGIISPNIIDNSRSPEDNPKDVSEFTEEDKRLTRKFMDLPTQYMNEIFFLLYNHFDHVRQEEERIGLNELIKKIEKRQNSDSIQFEQDGLGKAEPLLFRHNDKAMLFTKVRHNGLKRIFFFVDLDQAKLDLIEQAPSSNLSPEAYAEELKERRALSKYIRVLAARMIMQEWSSELFYQPGQDKPSMPENLQDKINEIMTESAESLESKSWFTNIMKKAADVTAQIETEQNLKSGWDVMLVGYSSSKQQILGSEVIQKPAIFRNQGSIAKTVKAVFKNTYARWVMYWHHIWEPPEYNKEVWKNNRGIKKLKVLLTGDYFNGLYWATKLSLMTFATTYLFQSMLPEGLDISSVVKNSFGFSLFFGVFSKTWSRFTGKATDFRTFAKNLLPGFTQTYSMFLMSDANLNPFKNGEWDPNAAKMHADAGINQGLKSDAKTGLQEEARMRFYNGEAQGKVVFRYPRIRMPSKELPLFSFEVIDREVKLPTPPGLDINDPEVLRRLPELQALEAPSFKFKDIQIKIPWITMESWTSDISKKSFESQSVQNITTPVGLTSRFGYTIDMFGVPVPIGHIAYAVLGPYGKFRALRAHEKYLEKLTAQYGTDHPETKRQARNLQDAQDYWTSMRLFSPYLKYRNVQNQMEEYDRLKQKFGPDHPTTIQQLEKVELARTEWENLKWRGLPYSQVLGYYPKVFMDVAVDLSKWIGKNLLYSGYRFYRAVNNALVEIEEHRKSTAEITDLIRTELLVQSEHPAVKAQRSLKQIAFETAPTLYRAVDNSIQAIKNSAKRAEEERLESEERTRTMNRLLLIRGEDGKPHPQQVENEVNRAASCRLLFNY
ncbi:MAG: hypothetical protein KDD37_07695 [Bdellovibrionales bacterium]|nr:hypothetical protein [Bdellovibrionales bacterium]